MREATPENWDWSRSKHSGYFGSLVVPNKFKVSELGESPKRLSLSPRRPQTLALQKFCSRGLSGVGASIFVHCCSCMRRLKIRSLKLYKGDYYAGKKNS